MLFRSRDDAPAPQTDESSLYSTLRWMTLSYASRLPEKKMGASAARDGNEGSDWVARKTRRPVLVLEVGGGAPVKRPRAWLMATTG